MARNLARVRGIDRGRMAARRVVDVQQISHFGPPPPGAG
jgi:hypothetical protein